MSATEPNWTFRFYGSGTRACTLCLLKLDLVKATGVATGESLLQWFECGKHGALASGELRVKLVPLDEWFKANEIRPPEGRD